MKPEDYCGEIVLQDTELSSTSKLVYLMLLTCLDEQNICHLTAEKLSRLVGSHRLSVVRALKDLENKYFISPIKGTSIKNRPQYSYKVLECSDVMSWWADKEIEKEADYWFSRPPEELREQIESIKGGYENTNLD